jgi:hypothetical protein
MKGVEEIKTHIFCSKTFFENRAVYEIMRKNIVEWGRSRMTIWRMRIACWIPKATNTLGICNTYCFSTATTKAPLCYVIVHCVLYILMLVPDDGLVKQTKHISRFGQ